MRKIFKKPTLFFILGAAFIIVGIPFVLYSSTLTGGESLGGTLVLVGMFVVALIMAVDRIIVTKIKTRKINITESLLLVIAIFYQLCSLRKITIDLSGTKTSYFVIVENNGTVQNSVLEYSFPFDKKLIFSHKAAVIHSISETLQQIDLTTPKYWQSIVIVPYNLDGFKIQFCSNGDLRLTESEIDSLIRNQIRLFNEE